MNIITDCIGQSLQVGDLVLRSMYSAITFHRIVRINKKSVSLSSGSREIKYSSGRTYKYRQNAPLPNLVDIEEFNNNNTNIRIYVDRLGKAVSIVKFPEL